MECWAGHVHARSCCRNLQARESRASLWPSTPSSNLEALAAKGRVHGKRKFFSHIAWPGPSPSPLMMKHFFPLGWRWRVRMADGEVVVITLFHWVDFLSHTALSESRIHTQGGFSLQINLLMNNNKNLGQFQSLFIYNFIWSLSFLIWTCTFYLNNYTFAQIEWITILRIIFYLKKRGDLNRNFMNKIFPF